MRDSLYFINTTRLTYSIKPIIHIGPDDNFNATSSLQLRNITTNRKTGAFIFTIRTRIRTGLKQERNGPKS